LAEMDEWEFTFADRLETEVAAAAK